MKKCLALSTSVCESPLAMHAHLALTVSEAARTLRVGNTTLRSFIASGELPAFHVGPQRGTRISLRALNAFIAERTFNVSSVDRCGHIEKQTNTPQL
jgi:excisionase family DNA binding protein